MVDEPVEVPADEVIAALAAHDLDALLADDDSPRAFAKLGEAANTAQTEALKQGFQLLASISSMMLDGAQWDTPYAPWFNIGTQRGPIPSDLTARDLEVLRWVAGSVANLDLSARASDIAWLQSQDRRSDIPFATLAVEKWASAVVEEGTWHRTTRDNLARAVALAGRMKRSVQLTAMQESLIVAARSSTQPWFVSQVSDFLLDQGMIGTRAPEILQALDEAIATLDPEVRALEGLLSVKSRVLRSLHRDEDAAAVDEAGVEVLIAEAQRRAGESQMIVASQLEEAFQAARQIPRRFRSERVKELIASLPARIREAGEASVDEMTETVSDGVDLTEAVRAAREAVRGKATEDALAAMASLTPFAKFQKDKEEAERSLDGSIMAIVGSVTVSADGRKVDSSEVDNYYGLPSAVWHRMHMFYGLRIATIAIGIVIPAMEVLTLEHRISEADLRYMARHAPIIPPDVERLYALGLYYGIRGEFAAALHLLAPQIEAMVRYHLREAGVDTDRIDPVSSISNETGLSTLMKAAEADQIFGEDLAWEIRALLCGPTGPNLRNDIAHGLISAGVANGPTSVYLWWFAMRLVFLPYYSKLRHNGGGSETHEGANDDEPPEP